MKYGKEAKQAIASAKKKLFSIRLLHYSYRHVKIQTIASGSDHFTFLFHLQYYLVILNLATASVAQLYSVE